MIPFGMSRLGWKSKYISFAQTESYPKEYLKYIDGLDIVKIKDDLNGKKIRICSKSIMGYIWRNARQIDVLHLYFLKHSILYALVYKLKYPKGFVYLKLDFNMYDCILRSKERIEPIRRFVYRHYLSQIPDLVSVEQNSGLNFIKQYYRISARNFLVLPNGVDDAIFSQFQIKNPSQRDNVVLVVGRIGAYVKNHEMILRALESIKDTFGWKVEFIGPIEDSFKKEISSFFSKNPTMKGKVSFLGPIYDRFLLFQKYNNSKVLCMSSRSEGFALTFAEAQVFGNYIISTEVSSTSDVIGRNPHLGQLYSNAEELSKLLSSVFKQEIDLDSSFSDRVEHGSQFLWSNICATLQQRIIATAYNQAL